ncbi:hypothetical protein HAX54_008366, partial [Datura stramonium]|nr:hypothetical protein [Datura stramonium]
PSGRRRWRRKRGWWRGNPEDGEEIRCLLVSGRSGRDNGVPEFMRYGASRELMEVMVMRGA